MNKTEAPERILIRNIEVNPNYPIKLEDVWFPDDGFETNGFRYILKSKADSEKQELINEMYKLCDQHESMHDYSIGTEELRCVLDKLLKK